MVSGKMPWHNVNFDNPMNAIMKIGLSDDIP